MPGEVVYLPQQQPEEISDHDLFMHFASVGKGDFPVEVINALVRGIRPEDRRILITKDGSDGPLPDNVRPLKITP